MSVEVCFLNDKASLTLLFSSSFTTLFRGSILKISFLLRWGSKYSEVKWKSISGLLSSSFWGMFRFNLRSATCALWLAISFAFLTKGDIYGWFLGAFGGGTFRDPFEYWLLLCDCWVLNEVLCAFWSVSVSISFCFWWRRKRSWFDIQRCFNSSISIYLCTAKSNRREIWIIAGIWYERRMLTE